MSTIEKKQIDSTKQRILLAAGETFARLGFKNSTVREICQKADVNLASVNYYFQDKQRLYVESVKFARQSRADEYPLPGWDISTSPEQKLEDFITVLLHRTQGVQEPSWQIQLLLREILFPTQACRELVEEYFEPFFKQLLAIIDEIVERPLESHVRHQLGFSVIGQILYYRFTAEGISMFVEQDELDQHFGNDQLAEHITSFCLAALSQYRHSNSTNQNR